jgi:hypothetical protein
MYTTHNQLSHDYCDRMAVIAGVGFKTCFRLAYDQNFWGLWNNSSKVTDRIENDIHREGDGSVPLASAQLDGIGELRYVKASHSILPNIPIVYEDVFRWLNQEKMELPETPAAALSRHLGNSDEMSEVPSLDGTLRSQISNDEDFNRWQLDESYLDELPQLQDRLEKGQLQEFITTRLL